MNFLKSYCYSVALMLPLVVTGCAQLPSQPDAQDATKAAREASLYAQCRVRPIGSWFDHFDERPTIACLEWRTCLLYNNQEEAPVLPGCE